MRKFRYFALAASALLAMAAIAAWLGWRAMHDPMSVPSSGAWLDVPSGTPLARVASRLAEQGILQHPRWLRIYARVKGDATRMHAGEYRLQAGSTPLDLLDMLVSGRVHLHELTVVEGWRFRDLLAAIRAHEAVAATTLREDEVMAALGSPDLHPEGQFFPETYRFARGTSDLELLRVAHEAMRRRLAEIWEGRSAESTLSDAYEALILASIIEKESALPQERRRISGVFQRRLQRGMRLQTDPTVIYGLGAAFDGDLRRIDLARDTPYNTYTRPGLPPTPIALPGAAALAAAVDPEPGESLYFVATGLGDGSHYFSATIEEHNAAVARYLGTLRSLREKP